MKNSTKSDNDGIPDGYEYLYGLNPEMDDSSLDMDNDGLTNYQEYNYSREIFESTRGIKFDSRTFTLKSSADPSLTLVVNSLSNGTYWNGTNPSNPDTDGDGIPDLYEILNAMDPKDNGTYVFDFNYTLIKSMEDSWHENLTSSKQDESLTSIPVLLNLSAFDPTHAFIPTGEEGNSSRGPDGDLDNDTLTNYEEYSRGMPEDYNLTIDGPYSSGLSPINSDNGRWLKL